MPIPIDHARPRQRRARSSPDPRKARRRSAGDWVRRAQATLAYADNNTGTGTLMVTDGRHAAATALLGNYMAGSVRLRIRRRWVTCGDFIERLRWGDISIFARPSFCHSLIRQKPETVLHSLGPSFYVGNNDTHPLKVVGGLWRTK